MLLFLAVFFPSSDDLGFPQAHLLAVLEPKGFICSHSPVGTGSMALRQD